MTQSAQYEGGYIMLNTMEVLSILEKVGLTKSKRLLLHWINQGELEATRDTKMQDYLISERDLENFIMTQGQKNADKTTRAWQEDEILLYDIRGLSANKKLILLTLHRYTSAETGDAGNVYSKQLQPPSTKTLMSVCGIKSKNTIIKSIRFFEWIGWISKYSSISKYSGYETNTYKLFVNDIAFALSYIEKKGISIALIEEYYDTLYANHFDILITNGCPFFESDYQPGDETRLLAPYAKTQKK